ISEIYTLSLHDALPISLLEFLVVFALFNELAGTKSHGITLFSEDVFLATLSPETQYVNILMLFFLTYAVSFCFCRRRNSTGTSRSEEHTSELQSRENLV